MLLIAVAQPDGEPRVARAVADMPSTVHALTLAALDEIGCSHPEVAIRLHCNLALYQGTTLPW